MAHAKLTTLGALKQKRISGMPDPPHNPQSELEHRSLTSQSNVSTSSSQPQQNQTINLPTDEPPSIGVFRRPRLRSTGTSGSTITQDSTIPLSPRQLNSSTHMPGPPPEEFKRKRPRVSKACTYCRKKKVKCDGNLPCSNCQENNEGECVYVADPEKKLKAPKPPTPSKPQKLNKAQTIQQLSLRLDKIETLLSVLTDEIRGTRQLASDNQYQSQLANLDENEIRPEKEIKNKQQTGKTSDNATSPEVQNNKFGSHSIIDIFTKSSLENIFQGLGPHNRIEVQDISHIGIIYNFFSHAFMDSICQPIKTTIRNRTDLMDNTFTDLSIPLEILNYLDDIYMVSYICDSSYVKSLFESYFKNNKKVYTKGPNSKLRSFTWSELMIMTVLIGLCISVIVDERNVGALKKDTKSSSSILQTVSDKQLVEIDSKCFFSAVFYYNRLVLCSEGVETVQALAIFVVYLQTVMSSVKLTHVPIAIAVRYAQDLGFHRIETYDGLSWHEHNTRKRLWWFCQTFEVSYCYRFGKPVIAREYRLASLIDDDKFTATVVQSSIEQMRTLWEEAKTLKDVSKLNELQENKTLHRCAAYFLYRMTKIRLQTFDLIYSISSQNVKLSKILTYIDQMNKDMQDLADIIQPPITICFYNDPRFFFKAENKPLDQVMAFDSAQDNILAMYMNFYQHLMTVNRTAIQEIPLTEENEPLIGKIKECRNISLESARTILHIVKGLNLISMPYSSFSWYMYEVFAAFCHLASLHFANPNTPEAELDLKLMIETSLKFFSYKNKAIKIQRNCIRQSLYDLTTRYLLLIFSNITNEEVKSKLFSKNKTLQKHLDLPVQFPEFYTSDSQLGVNLNSTSRLFEMWFRAYNFFNIASSSGGNNDGTRESSKPNSSNNESMRSSNANSTRNSNSSGHGSSMGNANTSTRASSEISNTVNDNYDKTPSRKKIDNILKHAISPLNSTKVRAQDYEDHLTDVTDQQSKQKFANPSTHHASHSIPANQLYTPQAKQSDKGEKAYNQELQRQTPQVHKQDYAPGSHPRQLHQIHHVSLASRPASRHLQPQPQPHRHLHQQPPPQHHQLHYLANYAPRYLDSSSTTSRHSQYSSNTVPQVYQVEWQQPSGQQLHIPFTLDPQSTQLEGVVPTIFESFDHMTDHVTDHNVTANDNPQLDMLAQFDHNFMSGSNMNEVPRLFDEND